MNKIFDNLIIRNEVKNDYREVEELIREAFFNLYVPGCNEHYLAHVIRSHEDYIPDLDFVAVLDNKIVANIIYTKSKLIDENGNQKTILTFGPISVLPAYQRMGIGKKLLQHSFKKALELGYDSIVIFGNPGNYVSRGFKSCKKFNICLENNVFPSAMLALELKPNVFDGRLLTFHESPVFNIDEKEAIKFDELFPKKEAKITPNQEEFFIYSHSTIN